MLLILCKLSTNENGIQESLVAFYLSLIALDTTDRIVVVGSEIIGEKSMFHRRIIQEIPQEVFLAVLKYSHTLDDPFLANLLVESGRG